MQHQTPSLPTSVFCVAASSDVAWLSQWETHLLPLRLAEQITVWSELHLMAGTPRTELLHKHLDQARVIVFLLSPDFFASDECVTLMDQALSSHARVIPLLLRPVDWKTSKLADLACLPVNGQFVTTWDNQDQALHTCVDDLRQLLGLPTVLPQSRKPARTSASQSQNRVRMLGRLRRSYRDLMNQSLQDAAWLELGMAEKPDAVQNAANFLLRTEKRPEQHLPPGTSSISAYDEAEQELLILGNPGTGKSTLLLDLAEHLVVRAEHDETHPLPVILPLSSWAVSRPKLEDWIAEQMSEIYDVPRKLSVQWVREGSILPLLDGLDEMEETARPGCIAAINTYHREQMAKLVVCSRTAEYEAATECQRLALQRAVVVQPLTHEDVDAYLVQAGEPLTALCSALKKNPVLHDLATTPLMLSILMLTYRGTTVRGLSRKGSPLLQQVWDDYVQRMVTRKGDNRRYPLSQTRLQLGWLARQMRQHNQTVFYLEHLQPSWLAGTHRYKVYQFLAERLPGALIGAAVALIVIYLYFDVLLLNVFNPPRLIFLYALPGAFIGGLLSQSKEKRGKGGKTGKKGLWINSLSSFLLRDLRNGALVCLCMTVGLSFDLGLGFFYALVHGSIFGFGALFLTRVIRTRHKAPLQTKSMMSLWQRGFLPLLKAEPTKNGLVIGGIVGLCYGLSHALSGGISLWIAWRSQVAYEMAQYGHLLSITQSEGLNFVLSQALGGGVQDWLDYTVVFTIIGVLVGIILTERDNAIQPAEIIRWSWQSFRSLTSFQHIKSSGSIGIVCGLIVFLANLLGGMVAAFLETGMNAGWNAGLNDALNFELTGQLSASLRGGLEIGLIVAVMYWWLIGILTKISSQSLDEHQRLVPNQGIRRSGRNGLLVGLISGLTSTLLSFLCIVLIHAATYGQWELFAMDQSTLVYLLIIVLIIGLDIGLLLTLLMGGLAWLRHYVLHFLLWRMEVVPWRYVQFLDDAVARILLRRIGGGYSFTHRLLLDHLADSTEYGTERPSVSIAMPLVPHQPPKKRRRIRLAQCLTAVGSLLGAIAVILAILQFTLGMQNLGGLIFPPKSIPTTTPTVLSPTSLPVTSTEKYSAISPGCEAGDPSGISWSLVNVKGKCLPEDGGMELSQTSYEDIPELDFSASSHHKFASDYNVNITISNLASNVCAGIVIRVNDTRLAYGLLTCGDGHWYIAKYSADKGFPTILQQSIDTTSENPSNSYNMQFGVSDHRCQMSVGNQIHEAQDPELVSTVAIGITFGEEKAMTSVLNATFLTSITASNFSYNQL